MTDTTREFQAPPERPFWLCVLRWMIWLAMLAFVLAFAQRNSGGAFIYQSF